LAPLKYREYRGLGLNLKPFPLATVAFDILNPTGEGSKAPVSQLINQKISKSKKKSKKGKKKKKKSKTGGKSIFLPSVDPMNI
jgi:hypothetical protein